MSIYLTEEAAAPLPTASYAYDHTLDNFVF